VFQLLVLRASHDVVLPSVVSTLPELPVWAGRRFVSAPSAVVAPVPPLATATAVLRLAGLRFVTAEPSTAGSFAVASSWTTRLAVVDFFRRLVFCFATGNGDMHLKNWALLEDEAQTGAMRLSPCYDLLNTRLALPREPIDIGLPLRGKTRNLQGSYFRKFAAENLKLPPRFIDSVFQELPNWRTTIEDFVPRSALKPQSKERYLEIVDERLAALAT
jgi:hypothetical protein